MHALPPLLRRALIPVALAAVAFGSAACELPQARSVSATAVGGSDAGQVVALVNAYRAANGVGGLTPAEDAMAKAQQHSNDMAAQGALFHSSSLASGIGGAWTALGENVGDGGSLAQIESMFQASGPHNANLLNGAYSQIGVGVAYGANGVPYITEIFVAR